MAQFTLKLLVTRDQKGKVKELEGGREFLIKMGD